MKQKAKEESEAKHRVTTIITDAHTKPYCLDLLKVLSIKLLVNFTLTAPHLRPHTLHSLPL